MLERIRAKISSAQDDAPLRQHLAFTLGGDDGPPGDQVVSEAVAISRNYVDSVPVLIERTVGAAQLTGGLDQIAPLMEKVVQYFLQEQDLVPDHLGLLGLLDDALFSNRMLEVVSTTYSQLAGVPLVSEDLGPANRAAAAFLGPQVATTISAAVDKAVQQRVTEVQLQAVATQGYAPQPGGSWGDTFEDQAAQFFAEHGGSGDISIYHNPVW
ncbi:MAG: hypothetical protein OEM67_05135 [Thermoleophilia bacterium]|nr:hypothetical protein [Thermoleophilia bacterium]MDH3724776.1 hypothetical protein [Thermoleophilia bacterium]